MKIMKSALFLLVALFIIGFSLVIPVPAAAQNDTLRFGGYNTGMDTMHVLPDEFAFVHQWIYTDVPNAEFATVLFTQFDPAIPNISVYRIDPYIDQYGELYEFSNGNSYYRAEWTDTPPRDGIDNIFVGGWSYINNQSPGTTTYASSNIEAGVRIGDTLYTGLIAQAYQIQNSITRLRGDVNDDGIVDTVDARQGTDLYAVSGPNNYRYCRGVNIGANEAIFNWPNMYDNYLLWAWTAGDPIADGFGFGLPMDQLPARINRNQPYEPTISGNTLHLITNATAVLVSTLYGGWQQTATAINGQVDINLPTDGLTLADLRIQCTRIEGITSDDMETLQTNYGSLAIGDVQPPTPIEFELLQNSPNPFNPSTTIPFTLVTAASIKLSVFDVQGRLVETLIDGRMEAGSHSVFFDATPLASGTYFYMLHTPGFVDTKRMVLLK